MNLISAPSLVDSAVSELRTLIESQHLAPGTRLPTEPELIKRLGVSRTVLREAMSRLELLGLVRVRAGRGTEVGDRDSLAASSSLIRTALTLSSADLLQFNELRTGIEVQSVRLAAERATPEDLALLEQRFEELVASTTAEEYVKRDCAFHLTIALLARNPLLLNVLEIVQDFMVSSMKKTMALGGDYRRGAKLHRNLLDGIKSRNAETAENVMREHMDVNRRVLSTNRT
jgi:GntR family transcriptional repressor for pyruvate dehydrogenase complex